MTISPAQLAAIRERFKGYRALLVTNRRNDEVERELEVLTGLEVCWVDSTQPRRLKAKKQAVRHGGKVVVLIATSFVGHDVDKVLKPPCALVDVPIISVGKGSISACLRALNHFVTCERR